MAALRISSDALARLRAVSGQEEYSAFMTWLKSLSDGERSFLTVGLLTICWHCVDPTIESAFLTSMEIDLPDPTERVLIENIDAGDWVRLMNNETHETVNVQVTATASGDGEITLEFDEAEPQSAQAGTPIVRTLAATALQPNDSDDPRNPQEIIP